MNLRNIKHFLIILLCLAILPIFTSSPVYGQPKKEKKKEICITFDELPASRAFGEVDVEALNY